jgi:hypothetical protein
VTFGYGVALLAFTKRRWSARIFGMEYWVPVAYFRNWSAMDFWVWSVGSWHSQKALGARYFWHGVLGPCNLLWKLERHQLLGYGVVGSWYWSARTFCTEYWALEFGEPPAFGMKWWAPKIETQRTCARAEKKLNA